MKGSKRRPTNAQKYSEGYDRIFSNKTVKRQKERERVGSPACDMRTRLLVEWMEADHTIQEDL